MKTTLYWKIRNKISRAIMFIFGHEYGCCSNMFKRCRNCKHVKGEKL